MMNNRIYLTNDAMNLLNLIIDARELNNNEMPSVNVEQLPGLVTDYNVLQELIENEILTKDKRIMLINRELIDRVERI